MQCIEIIDSVIYSKEASVMPIVVMATIDSMTCIPVKCSVRPSED